MPEIRKKSAEKPIIFQFKGIELLDFCFHPKKEIPAEIAFNFEIKIEHKVIAENSIIAVVVKIDINDSPKGAKLGSVMASCIFEVPDMNKHINPKNNLPEFTENFLTTINSISLSTVRGIMFSQFRGTFLHNAVLPVIDPKLFVTQK